MIKRITDKEYLEKCDELLNDLIVDEMKYDEFLDSSIKVKDYYIDEIKNENNVLFGYFDNDNLVGYIYLKKNNESGYKIDALYVRPEFRNREIGTKLLQEGINYLKSKNAEFIDINVLKNNFAAYNLYKKCGFEDFKINMRLKKE